MLPKQENYPLARRLAVENLQRSNLQERVSRSGGTWESGPGGEIRVRLSYLSQEFQVSFPQGRVETPAGGGSLSLREEILILHYLETAKGTALAERWISFAEIPGGSVYHPVFLLRCKSPLLKFLGEDPAVLPAAAAPLGGERLALGDVGIRIPALPRVPLALILWRGDSEFSPEGNLLFDASVSDYLPLEDIVILAETVVWKLIKKLKTD